MRALVVGDSESVTAKVKAVVLHSGFECRPADIVPFGSAAECLGRTSRELIVLVISSEPQCELPVLREIRNTSQAIVVTVGPVDDARFVLRVLHKGADEYVDADNLEVELESTLVRLKAKRLPQANVGRIVGVLAASGGCGASTVAVNLAAALAKRYKQSALFDLRLAAGDQSVLLDLKPNHTLADLCRNSDRMDWSMVERSMIRHPSGVHLLAAPDTLVESEYVTPQGVRQALSIARTAFPYVVVDFDRLFRSEQQAAIVQTDLLLLILRLDMTSLRNAQRLLDSLDELGIHGSRVQVVINRYGQPKEVPASRAQEVLGIQMMHYIPNDPSGVNLSNNQGVPVVLKRPRAKVSKSMTKLAMTVGSLHELHIPNGQPKDATLSKGHRPFFWRATSSAT